MNMRKQAWRAVISAAAIAASAIFPSFGATYYKVGSDPGSTTSFEGNASSSVGWSITQGATKPDATISDFANSDFIVDAAKQLRTPPTATDAVTFGGRSLTFTGGAYLTLKKETNGGTRKVTVPNMIIDGNGAIGMAQDVSHFILDGAISLNANSTFRIEYGCNDAPDWRALTIDAVLAGDATTTLQVDGGTTAKSANRFLVLNNAASFLGTITGLDSAKNFSLTVNGAFGGTITSLPATTKSVTFDYGGLPAATGLRVVTTTIPAALKTKLLFYSATTDFSTPSLKLLTFPAGTTVDPVEFTIMYADSPDGEKRQFELELVTNGDDTLSLVAKGGRTFYKIGTDPGGYTSFATNYTDAIGWAESSGDSATVPFSMKEMTNSTFVVGVSAVLRTPASSAADTFGGKTLRLEGNGTVNNLMLKGANNSTLTIPHLVFQNGRIFAGDKNYAYTLKGKIDIVSGSSLYMCGADSGTRTIYIDSDINGDATTKISAQQMNSGTQVFHVNNAAGFLGEVTVAASTTSPTKLYINGPFGGSVGTLGAKLSTLVVNYDGLPADKGLRCTAESVPAPLKTKLTFYSATTDFGQHHLPLITFPAGTVIDPAEFTVKHATTRDGAAETFPLLTTYTAGDGSVVLAVDASYPTTARLVGGAWQFYGSDGRDVTATCGLTTPTAEITVLIGSTDELAAIRAAGITPKGYRLLSSGFDVTGATDISDISPLAVDAGFAIDLKGGSFTVPGTFFGGFAASSQSLLVNGDFSADDMQGMTPVQALPSGHVPSGWAKAGTTGLNAADYKYVILIKNDASNGYRQQDGATWVKISKNYWISQDFTLLAPGTVTLSYKVAAANASSNTKNTTDYKVQIDGVDVFAETGRSVTTVSKTITYALGVGTHTLKFVCASTTQASTLLSNIKLTTQGGEFTDSIGGGALHVNVATNTVVENTYVALAGKLNLVKEGWGDFRSQCLLQSYDGGNEVVRGTLSVHTEGQNTLRFAATARPLGALGSHILVHREGTFDIAGNYEYGNYDIVLDGGTLKSAAANGTALLQTQTSWDGIGAFSLATNSTLYLRSDVVVNGFNEKPVDLGGWELFVDASVGAKQLHWSKDMTNGTFRFGPCDYQMDTRLVIYGRDVDARTVDLIDEGGLVLNAALSVRNYTAARAYSNKNTAGTTNLCVYGTFTPETDYFYGCTMMDGSAIDLSSKDAPWSLTSAETNGLTNVVFETGATVCVKLGSRRVSSRSPVIAWNDGNRPANLDTLKFTSVEGERRRNFIKKEDGLYVTSGFMIIVK